MFIKKIYGRSYAELYRKKRIVKMKKMSFSRRKKTKKVASLKKIMERLKSKGTASKICDGPPFIILANGFKLGLKVSSKPVMIGEKLYYLFRKGKGINVDVDFFICLCRNDKKDIHFIIPSNIMPKSGISILHEAEPNRSKYGKFKEAWQQLVPDLEEKRQKIPEVPEITPSGLAEFEILTEPFNASFTETYYVQTDTDVYLRGLTLLKNKKMRKGHRNDILMWRE